MDIRLSAEELAFRDDVRAFLREAAPPSMRRANDLTTGFIVEPEISIHFHRALARKGWSVTGWTPVQRYLFEIECGRAGAAAYNGAGSQFVGPVIIRFGTQEQKDKYLPR